MANLEGVGLVKPYGVREGQCFGCGCLYDGKVGWVCLHARGKVGQTGHDPARRPEWCPYQTQAAIRWVPEVVEDA